MTTTHGESEFARTAKLTSHVSSSSRPIGTRIKSAQAPEAAGHCVWSGGRRLHGHRRYAERPTAPCSRLELYRCNQAAHGAL
jgi:hypothetical protein